MFNSRTVIYASRCSFERVDIIVECTHRMHRRLIFLVLVLLEHYGKTFLATAGIIAAWWLL